nr:uncharacterized protein LOC127334439 [Lolium perenne]
MAGDAAAGNQEARRDRNQEERGGGIREARRGGSEEERGGGDARRRAAAGMREERGGGVRRRAASGSGGPRRRGREARGGGPTASNIILFLSITSTVPFFFGRGVLRAAAHILVKSSACSCGIGGWRRGVAGERLPAADGELASAGTTAVGEGCCWGLRRPAGDLGGLNRFWRKASRRAYGLPTALATGGTTTSAAGPSPRPLPSAVVRRAPCIQDCSGRFSYICRLPPPPSSSSPVSGKLRIPSSLHQLLVGLRRQVKLDYWKCMLFVKIMLMLKLSEFKTDYDQVIEVLVKTVHLS